MSPYAPLLPAVKSIRLAKQISVLDSDLKAKQIKFTEVTTKHTPSRLAMHREGAGTVMIVMTG